MADLTRIVIPMGCTHGINQLFTRAIVTSLLGLVGLSVACNRSPAAPTPAVSIARPTITSISPPGGLNGDGVRLVVVGTGFLSGAILTLGGVAAKVTSASGTAMAALTPVHTAGTVDVVVTNPDGESGTLTGGYTYQSVTLTVSSNQVASGSPLKVNWATSGTFTLDAPTQSGEYEFRYLLDDDFGEAGRSKPVTVSAPASPSIRR